MPEDHRANKVPLRPPGLNRKQWRDLLRHQGLLPGKVNFLPSGKTTEPSASDDANEKKSSLQAAILWLRGVGFSSIALGGFGLMQTFFSLSVGAVYFGFAVLLADLWVEKFKLAVKIGLVASILVGAFFFTKIVVVRSAPLSVGSLLANGELDVIVQNMSAEDDYQDIDIKIKPDFPYDFVKDPKQITSLPSVSFVDAMPFTSSTYQEKLLVLVDEKGNHPMTNFLRVRCDKLPRLSSIEVRFNVVRPSGKTAVPFTDIKSVFVEGRYRGRFKEYAVKNNSGVMRFPINP